MMKSKTYTIVSIFALIIVSVITSPASEAGFRFNTSDVEAEHREHGNMKGR